MKNFRLFLATSVLATITCTVNALDEHEGTPPFPPLVEENLPIHEIPITGGMPPPDYQIPATPIPPTASVPEPNSVALLFAGIIGMLFTRHRK